MRSNHELMQLDVEQEYILSPVLPVGGIWMIAGAPKAGKSLLAAGVAEALVDKRVEFFHGMHVKTHGKVLYINLDMGVVSHRKRFLNMEEEKGSKLKGLYHITRDEVPASLNIINPPSYEWLASQVRDLKPMVIIFDVLRRFFTGDENSSDVAQNIMNAVTNLMREGESAAILVHHTNKTSEISKNMGIEKNPIEAVRGSSSIAGSADTICAFNDNATSLHYQGRDVNLKYMIKKGQCGIPQRWISKTTVKRADAIERLLAGIMVQAPTLDADGYYNLVSPHVDEFTKDDFKAIYAKVKTSQVGYDFL
jgi:KaiC/GvpD/RAD55 family RecA-like ATPase